MTRDYRSRAQPQRKPESPPTPAWVPFFYGFLLGATCVAIGWVVLTPAGTPLEWPGDLVPEKQTQTTSVNSKKETQPERPKFTFYTILPEMEVVISDEEARPPAASESNPARIEENTSRYRLQVGSFKKLSDADRQKARLALLGVEAEIQKVNIGEGDIYYRVLTQTFSTKKELNQKRKMFQKNKINSLIVQVRN